MAHAMHRYLRRAGWKNLPQTRAASDVPMDLAQKSVVLCADFDQTITARDTIALLFEAANAKIEGTERRVKHQRDVHKLVQQYAHESSSFMASTLGGGGEISALDKPFDEYGLREFLQAFAMVDLRSIERVVESRTLAGLEFKDLDRICADISVLEGCVEALGTASQACVISSNWSETMIRETLRRRGLVGVDVIANELVMDGSGVSTGDIELRAQSPSDKAFFLTEGGLSKEDTQIFVGDSINDLLAMLQADIGIALAPRVGSTFVGVCHHFGISLIPVGRQHTIQQCKTIIKEALAARRRVILTSESWEQIRGMLSNSDTHDHGQNANNHI